MSAARTSGAEAQLKQTTYRSGEPLRHLKANTTPVIIAVNRCAYPKGRVFQQTVKLYT
jgi:hypothetical protein